MTDIHLAAPTAPEGLRLLFLDAINRPTSINEHLTVLRDTASGLKHITEFGVGDGWSTRAWLLVQPDRLQLVDLGYQPCFPELERNRGRTEIVYWIGDDRLMDIESTQLLFIDTIHTYSMLKEELRLHAGKVSKFLVFHDTTTFGDVGEDGGPGLWPAIVEFLGGNPAWHLHTRFTHNNGLTILQRD